MSDRATQNMRSRGLKNAYVQGGKPDVVAVIPARGGSKGVFRKNARMLCGKPLIAYSIEAALATPNIDRVFVSTEDEEIAAIAESFGAEVPFLRPAHLAHDRAEIGQVVSHLRAALRESGYHYEVQLTLYPTHPFRSPDIMAGLVDKLVERYTTVLAVKPVQTPRLGFAVQRNGRLIPLQDKNRRAKDQVYIRSYGSFVGASFLHSGLPKVYHHLLKNPIEHIDIDTPEDFCLAEQVIKSGLYKGGICRS